MTLPTITPAQAQALINDGARLIDIRDPDEHRRQSIPGASNMPPASLQPLAGKSPVIWHCRSGMRTAGNAAVLAENSGCPAYLLEGGIDAWRAAGFPVRTDAKAPLELMRQVQIAAGLMVLAGVILSLTVAQGFVALAGFVGAGLVFAGVTGSCGMARLLAQMPWNRRAA
jgi:rhodanese-related sulfurtransferase